MADRDEVALTITVTTQERQQIEELARQRGYDTPSDYLRALIESDVKAQSEIATDEDNEIDPVASFRQSWKDALAGKTRPISELWDELDDE